MPDPRSTIRIAIGENHPDLAESLSMLIDLQDDLAAVGHASSNDALQRLEREQTPDVYILDLSLDDGSSIPLMRALREQRPDVVLIAYTGHSSSALTDQCLKAGCDRVLTKAGPIDELLAAIRGAVEARRPA